MIRVRKKYPILPLLQVMALYHDSPQQSWSMSASLPPPQKERFAGKKHARFPGGAIAYCLAEAGLPAGRAQDAQAPEKSRGGFISDKMQKTFFFVMKVCSYRQGF